MKKIFIFLAALLLLVITGCTPGGWGPASSAKAITAFSFSSPLAVATIDENAKTISITVPYNTSVTALVATFTTTGATVKVDSTVQVSGTTPNDFTNPVSYVVTAVDGSIATYIVTVTVAPYSAKAITAFSFTNPMPSAVINEEAKTISVNVPHNTNVTALVATFITTGASVTVGSTVQVSGKTSNDFTNPVSYVVTAADGSTATYTVTVTVALNYEKAITSFSFNNPAASGIINERAKTISVTVPYNTNVTALIAIFTTTGTSVKVGSTVQVSGTTQNDFTNPVIYTVTAQDNSTTTYTVTVTFSKDVNFLDYIAIPTGSWPEAVAIGDVNNDGRNDVVMTTSYYFDAANDYKIFVFLQNASGGLEAPIKYGTSASYTQRPDTVAIGDINNDGRNDVVIGTGSGIEVFLQNNSGTLNSGIFYTSSDSIKIRIADLNHDGLLDIVGIGLNNTVSVWIQNAGGTFNSPVIYNVTYGGVGDLEVGDVNNDGLVDIIVMSGSGLSSNLGILTQKSDGTFNTPVYYSVSNPVTADTLTDGVAVGDINGDNLNDVVVTYGGNRPYSKIGVFSQNNSGTLNPVVSYISYDIPEPVEIADVNGDGFKDIIVLHGGWNRVGIYQQSADGTLQSENLFTIPYASHYNTQGLAVGDINSDGRKDIVIADYNNGLVILYGN